MVGQEAIVAHHFKVSCQDMADVRARHILLSQLLPFILLRRVVIVLVHHRTATVMAELRRSYRWAFQIPAEIFQAAPGTADLFGEVDLPVVLILRLQVALLLFLIVDTAEVGQFTGIDSIVTGTQQADNGTAPDGSNLLFFLKNRSCQSPCLTSRPPRIIETWMADAE